jgi:type IV secretion system protein VirB6
MSIPSYNTVVEAVLHEIDLLLENYVFHGYSALADYLSGPLGLAVTLYIILMGYSLSMGWLSMSIREFSKGLVKIGLIYLFAMNWGWFSDYLINLFFNVSGHIGTILVDSTPLPLPSFAGEGIDGGLQSVLIELWDIGQWLWNAGSFHALGPLLVGLITWACGFLLIGYALFEIIFAKCILSVLCVVAPLFISFALFSSTEKFFYRWISLCSGYAFLMILVMATIAIVLSLDQWAIGDAYLLHAKDLGMLNIFTIVFVSLICIGVINRVCGLALVLGNGVGAWAGNSAVTDKLSHFFSGASGFVVGGYSAFKNKLSPTHSNNKTKQFDKQNTRVDILRAKSQKGGS